MKRFLKVALSKAHVTPAAVVGESGQQSGGRLDQFHSQERICVENWILNLLLVFFYSLLLRFAFEDRVTHWGQKAEGLRDRNNHDSSVIQ